MYYNTINSSEEVEKTTYMNELLRLQGQAEKLWRSLEYNKVLPPLEARCVRKHLAREAGKLEPELLFKLSSYIIQLQTYQQAAFLARNLAQDRDARARQVERLLVCNDLRELDRTGLALMVQARGLAVKALKHMRNGYLSLVNEQYRHWTPLFALGAEPECYVCRLRERLAEGEKGSIMARKLGYFLEESVFYLPKSRDAAEAEINERVRAKRLTFTIPEMSLFQRLADSLVTESDDVTRCLIYLQAHRCHKEVPQASSNLAQGWFIRFDWRPAPGPLRGNLKQRMAAAMQRLKEASVDTESHAYLTSKGVFPEEMHSSEGELQKQTIVIDYEPGLGKAQLSNIVSLDTIKAGNAGGLEEPPSQQTSATLLAGYNSLKILQQPPSGKTLHQAPSGKTLLGTSKTQSRRRDVILETIKIYSGENPARKSLNRLGTISHG